MADANGTGAKVHVDKIASVTYRLGLESFLRIGPAGRPPRRGDVVVVKALEEKTVYDTLELVGGRMAKISRGDVIAGALGARRALKGFVGDVPETLQGGDRLYMLNLGGVIGTAKAGSRIDIGSPLAVEYLGTVLRDGPRSIEEGAIAPASRLESSIPIVAVAGSAMNTGKTLACCRIIQQLTQQGRRLAAAKVSGVACLRDLYAMQDHGALAALSFVDCGLPSTVDIPDLNRLAKGLVNQLLRLGPRPEVVVLELGDGILGRYGLASILNDHELMHPGGCLVVCASDLVAAWGAKGVLSAYGLNIDVLSGPATDNALGTDYIQETLKIPAANAAHDAPRVAELVARKLWGAS